ncbi:MAG: hypothetical protein K0Q90_206 [Paenibacillaceae bacterium]|jgi:hypothetical protein|nr:hypothetical protein [Paenibacillaceae bacterium]
MNWKLALYDFIHARNQTETDYDTGPLRQLTADGEFLRQMEARQERRRFQHLIRGFVPVRSEIRLGIKRVEASEREAVVDIRLTQAFQGRVGSRLLTEDSWWTERLTFTLAREGACLLQRIQQSPHADRDERLGLLLENAEDVRQQLPPPFLKQGLQAAARSKGAYNRKLAVEYAEQFWETPNPAYIAFEVDCSNYVSQCILAGGHYMDYTGRREAGWWYRGRSGSQELWSYSWAVANALQLYLGGKRNAGLRTEEVGSPKELEPGDVISYSWNGDGRYGHSTVVTAFDPDSMPLVNAHTVNCRHRYWDYSDSYAWTEATKYRFFHILEP